MEILISNKYYYFRYNLSGPFLQTTIYTVPNHMNVLLGFLDMKAEEVLYPTCVKS